jgi:hypothetical protein
LTLQLENPLPAEVDAGAGFSFTVVVVPPPGGCFEAAPFKVMDGDCVRLAGNLPDLTDDHHHIADVSVTAPEQIGTFEWTFVIPAREIGGVAYEEASLAFSFTTRQHETSLAAWGHPSPVVAGETFGLTVGAKCAAGCGLIGRRIDIQDERGTLVASGILDNEPWPETRALYWTRIEVAAPGEEGCWSWSLRFTPTESQLPHGAASASFSFLTVRPPEHDVSVNVVESGTNTPVPDAQVRLGVYRASTDEAGTARFAVPAGAYRLFVWKAGYDAPARTIDIIGQESVQVEAGVLPEEDPYAYWRG